MKYSALTDTLEVSKICFGCEPLGGCDWGEVSIRDIESAINKSIELGVNFFDTADVYGLGLSERRLSEILGVKRHDLVIATKGGVSWNEFSDSERAKISMDSSPLYLRKAVEASLKRLRLDYLPVYYIHWADPDTDIRITFEFISRLQREGKIGLIGCSNYNSDQIRQACEVADIALAQVPLNIITGPLSNEFLTTCEKNNIKLVAYNVLASGLLTGKYDENSKFGDDDRRSRLPLFQGEQYIKAIHAVRTSTKAAEVRGMTVGQFSINWVLEQCSVVSAITGIKNVMQVKQNVKGVVNE